MSWWLDSDWYYDWYSEEAKIKKRELECPHEWKAIGLITSIVYNCSMCGMKKEDFDKKEED